MSSIENTEDVSTKEDTENISEEEPLSKKKPSKLAIALIVIGVVCVVGLAVGLSVGLTTKKSKKTPLFKPTSIAFIAAMEAELNALVDTISPDRSGVTEVEVNHVKLQIIKYKSLTIYAALSGVGKVNSACTTALILSKYSPQAVINVGVAGGFDETEKILDIAISTGFVYTDADLTSFGDPWGKMDGEPFKFPASKELKDHIIELKSEMKELFSKELPNVPNKDLQFHYGLFGSGDQFISRDDQVANIQSHFNSNVPEMEGEPLVSVEMEGASVAHVCYKFNTPIIGIRSLSDIAVVKHDNTDDYENSLTDASKTAALLSILLVQKIADLK